MSDKLENFGRIGSNPFAENIDATGFVRGSVTPTEFASIVIEQVKSTNPKQIRVLEGMGREIFDPPKIRRIKRLPTEKRLEEAEEIVQAMLDADVVIVESPTPPKSTG